MNRGVPCSACGSTEAVGYAAVKKIPKKVDPVEAGTKMGRIVGNAAATIVAPGNGAARALFGGFGAFLGRRVGRGHALISVGYAGNVEPVENPVDKKARARKPRKRKSRKRAPRSKQIESKKSD